MEPQKPQKEYEVDFDVKDTGQKKDLIGYHTHEAIVTVTVREKGKTLEEGGGMVMTSDMWLGPRIPELKELADFDMRYWKALQEGSGVPAMSPEQVAQVMAMFPLFGRAMDRMQKDGDKISGTALDTTTTLESVKSPDQMTQSQQPSGGAGGGGISGMLAHKMMKKSDLDRLGARDRLHLQPSPRIWRSASRSTPRISPSRPASRKRSNQRPSAQPAATCGARIAPGPRAPASARSRRDDRPRRRRRRADRRSAAASGR